MSALFACTKCHQRYPFEQLSASKQLCTICRNDSLRCRYCKIDFNQENKGFGESVCKNCSHSHKVHGKPSACDYCEELAAFVGKKCQRCTHQEKKFGAPKICDRCKKNCAFDRGTEYKKNMNNELLCWLCIAAFKKIKSRRNKIDSPHLPSPSLTSDNTKTNNAEFNDFSPKKRKLENGIFKKMLDVDGSEHLVSITQLNDSIELLKKQMQSKDLQLIQKDQKITELKAEHFEQEKHMRTKIQTMQNQHDQSVEILQEKIRDLQKKLALNAKNSKNKNL